MTVDTQAPAPAPTGDYVLVPREPTPEMLAAIALADWLGSDDLDWRDGWRIMLAASPTPSPVPVGVKSGIYVASKTRHAPTWKAYRGRGWPINSTWIDEAGEGESGDLADLWRRCIGEASSAAVLVVYREPDDVLKGGWVEVGAALASGVPVYAVGLDGFTIAHDRRIRHFETLDDAMDAAARVGTLAVTIGRKIAELRQDPAFQAFEEACKPRIQSCVTTPLAGEAGVVEGDDSDMALIGRSFMASLDTITAMDGPYKDWTPAEDPAELVLDLYNDLIEARESALSLIPPKAETETGAGETVAVPYDDFHAAYRHVPRSRMSPDDCLKTRLRAFLRAEDVAYADEAEAYTTVAAETASEREREHLTDTEVMEWLVERCGGHSVTIRRAGQRLVGWSAGSNAVAIADLRAALSTETGR